MTDLQSALPGRDARPVLVCLHWLGGSGRSWDRLVAALAPHWRVLTVDLPGFGDAAHQPGVPVAGMADHVVAMVQQAAPDRWTLIGHSMGAKVALAVARRAEDGAPGLEGLTRLVLLAGSPPAPEPMDEDRRSTMLDWFTGHPDQSRDEAQTFIDGNVGADLDPATNARTATEILRLNRQAWVSWLESGSREDWADRIGILRTPALIVAGEKDGDLGPDGQRRLMTRHFADPTFAVVPGAGHLLPVEQPEAVARLIEAHADEGAGSTIPPHYRAFIASDRVSARVRGLMRDRGRPDDAARTPKAMSAVQIATLRAMVDRILPQPEPRIDIAARMDEGLATTAGDGWRFVDLPPDQECYRRGLDTLRHRAEATHGTSFETLTAERQDALLATLPGGKDAPDPAEAPGLLSPHQMALWFEDVRANTVRVYMSHPLAMARIGFSGIGYGGDGPRLQGFETVGLGQTESWEPEVMEAGR